MPVKSFLEVLIPDEWGKSSDILYFLLGYGSCVLIPDEWGKSSDVDDEPEQQYGEVLIPDEWGKSSDLSETLAYLVPVGLNPR